MGLELTRAMVFTIDVAAHAVNLCVGLCTRGSARTRRVVGSALLFLVARPFVGRLNLGR